MFYKLQPTKKYFLVMFLISSIFLEAFTLVIYQQSIVNKKSHDWVVHSYQVLRISRLAQLDAIDMAGNQQEYMVTGYYRYLDGYKSTSADIERHLTELTETIKDSREQSQGIAALRARVNALKQVCETQIHAMRTHSTNVYSLSAGLSDTKKELNEVRAAFDSFNQNEAQLLDARSAIAGDEQRNYLLTLIMGTVLGLGALVIANIVIFSLISKNTRAEDKLRKSEELFSAVLGGISDGIFDHNVAAGTIYYSPSYQHMLGYSEKELGTSQDKLTSLIHPDDIANVKDIFYKFSRREIPSYSNIFRLRHKDGHWVWILSRGVGMWGADGKLERLIGAHTDITMQKQREEELRALNSQNQQQQEELAAAKEKAEAAGQAKSDFLAMMSHEIRTPMNVVVGLAHLLQKTALDAKQADMTKTLSANADVLLKLVDDLLDLSRIQSGQVELETRSFTIDGVYSVLRSMFDDQAAAKGLTLSLSDLTGGKTYAGDAVRIQQILANLVSNAVKFTPRGSIIVTADASDNNSVLRVTVADTGVGIPADKLPVIFEKFVQADQTIARRFGGSGLGLSISKLLARKMGGDIDVASQLGKGTVFTLSLPMQAGYQHNQAPAADPTAKTADAHAGGTVLVVEDYAANVMVVTMMLENFGYMVDIASSGETAIRKVGERATPYTAILMDVQMQDMDGLQATRHIRELEKEKGFRHTIIGVTAHALAGDRDRCLQAGMDDYLSKPIHPNLLEKKLQQSSQAA